MSTKFYTLLTDIGAAKLASAAALGVPLKITHMAVGDGGGTLPTPDAKQTALVNEKRRAALNMRHCCKVSDEAAFCLIQRPYISKTLLTRRISPRGSP